MTRHGAGILLLAAAIAGCGTANAVPGVPMGGCETQILGNVYCDGPIRMDGSFKRCLYAPGSWTGGLRGFYTPPVTNCFLIDPTQPWPALPLGQPQHHID
jgi:hypothetical protein